MEKKTLFLELPCELIEKIDRFNQMGDRSVYITDLLEKQLNSQTFNEIDTTIRIEDPNKLAGQIDLFNNEGESIGRFNINTLEGFQELAKTIQNISKDPVVRVKARQWL
jgi:hypothetical protein